jgi:hypothetical protein
MTEEVKSESEKKKEDWMNSKWRPAMGWMYMLTCITDFVLFPILWSLAQTLLKQPITQWQPLTLQGAGLFHIAMGAVLGIAAMGRTQEKLAGANNGGAATTTPGLSSSFAAPSTPSSSFGTPANSFATPSTNSAPFSPAPSWGTTPVANSAEVTTGFGGKPAPVIPPFPER